MRVGILSMSTTTGTEDRLLTLPLDAWHRARGARMVPFAGYAMPVQYRGIIAEHEWTRQHASLFDVSHMGQIVVVGDGAASALERLLPADLAALRPGRLRYSLLLAENGGIRDDLMISRLSDGGDVEAFGLVVNGAMKMQDFQYLRAQLPSELAVTLAPGMALLALQGPEAAAVLASELAGDWSRVGFLEGTTAEWRGHELAVSRTGYTGEDGFEISLPGEAATAFADALLADERVQPAGLGARDSLRLEAGLPLCGHDIGMETDPVSAGLAFALSKRRREEGGYPGHERIARILAQGPERKRVGLSLEGRLPAREDAPVFIDAKQIGHVTSGGFSPTLGHPIAMAWLDAQHCAPGTAVEIAIRDRRVAATIVPMPFVPHRYYRRGAAE